jgi:hypothetical protein
MEVLDPRRVVKVLRRELDVREISGRELDRRLRKLGRETIRKALAEGLEGRFWLERLGAVLEAAEIDARVFLALVTGGEVPLRSLVGILACGEEPAWNRREKTILSGLSMRRLRGAAGFAELRSPLRHAEELREEDPEAAEALAWQALERATEAGLAGAAAGALAVLAGCCPRAKAQALLQTLLEVVGDEPPASLLAGKIFANLGRVLVAAGFPQQALRILRYRAYPDVQLDGGEGDDLAVLLLDLFRAARGCEQIEASLGYLEKAAACAGDRLRFVALHQRAAVELELGRDFERAALLYDALPAEPHFAAAPPASRARIRWFRLKAHLEAGRLTAAGLPEFESTWEENRELLATVDRVRFCLDFAGFLQSLGEHEKATELLKSEFLTMLELDGDVEGLQSRFSASCKVSKVRLDVLFDLVRR